MEFTVKTREQHDGYLEEPDIIYALNQAGIRIEWITTKDEDEKTAPTQNQMEDIAVQYHLYTDDDRVPYEFESKVGALLKAAYLIEHRLVEGAVLYRLLPDSTDEAVCSLGYIPNE